MNPPAPHFREAGAGPGVVCIHSNASSSAQWRGLMELLSPRHRVLANGVDGIRFAVQSASAALDAGDRDAAARHFIDFWMGDGSWDATPPQRKPAFAASIGNVRRWKHALFTEPLASEALQALDIPVLYMLGAKSPESAHAVARELLPLLRRATVVEFPELGHMGPVTHPETVNTEIAKFLGRV